MSSWTSFEGVWYPAKEKVGLINHSDVAIKNPISGEEIGPGEPWIYEGPDRAALLELYEADKSGKTTTLGQHFSLNSDFRQLLRDKGFKDAKEYLDYIGYDSEEAKKKFEANASQLNKHELPKKVQLINRLGGGQDTATGKLNRYGNFGDAPNT